jgi:hypothetical protein
MNIGTVIDTVTNTLNSARIPAPVLPAFLLRCLALTRPGLSAYKIASAIIQKNAEIGIPAGDTADGKTNLINAYTYNIVREIVSAIKNDAAVQIAIPMQSLLIQAIGSNAGGPVTCVGSNILDSLGNGIIQ